jgi:glycosyltransferase involved in cell wall biosynthesis
MATISVIIPTYNCARYIGESLESILRQTTPPTEIVVVDDGSTDDTTAALVPYASRIVLARLAHGGYASARNHGLARATGDWIAFHDADDVALEDRLAAQLDFLFRHPEYDGVFCDGARMDDASHLVPRAIARRVADRALSVEDVFTGFPVYFQAAVVRRAAFAEVGGFEPGLHIHPDMDYGYRLFSRRRLAFLDRVVFRYRWHGANTTRDTLRGREEIARVLDRLAERDPEAVRRIGRRRLRARLARHYYRIARRRILRGEAPAARAALDRALALRPLDPRYHLLRLWHAA